MPIAAHNTNRRGENVDLEGVVRDGPSLALFLFTEGTPCSRLFSAPPTQLISGPHEACVQFLLTFESPGDRPSPKTRPGPNARRQTPLTTVPMMTHPTRFCWVPLLVHIKHLECQPGPFAGRQHTAVRRRARKTQLLPRISAQ